MGKGPSATADCGDSHTHTHAHVKDAAQSTVSQFPYINKRSKIRAQIFFQMRKIGAETSDRFNGLPGFSS